MQGMAGLLKQTLGENVVVTLAFPADPWPIEADAGQLENALLNLAINTRDAMPAGGKLTITTTNVSFTQRDWTSRDLAPGDHVGIAVRDTGVGMPQSVVDRALDPFFTTKRIGEGTGLGLSMIFGFTKQSGGHVSIESEVARGTTVKLYLPRASATVPGRADTVAAMPARARSGETVMVVDDEDLVRLVMTDVPKELDYKHVHAIDGATALPILRSAQKIDLLITDIGLPGMNGRQLSEMARRLRPDLKVLFVTGYAGAAGVHGRLNGATDLLCKPFALNLFSEKVRSMLAVA